MRRAGLTCSPLEQRAQEAASHVQVATFAAIPGTMCCTSARPRAQDAFQRAVHAVALLAGHQTGGMALQDHGLHVAAGCDAMGVQAAN